MRSYKITMSQLEKFIALCESRVVDTQGKYNQFQHELAQVIKQFSSACTEMKFIEAITDERTLLGMEPQGIHWMIKNLHITPEELTSFKLNNRYLYE